MLAKKLLVVSISITIIACSGWHLRGSDAELSNATIARVALTGTQNESYQLLARQLGKTQHLVNITEATRRLEIGKEQWRRRQASLDSSISTAEYELTFELVYSIFDSEGQRLRGPSRARSVRSYRFDENDIAGKENEEKLLRKEMRRAAVRQILQQLSLTQTKAPQ